MKAKKINLLYEVNEKPSFWLAVVLGIQHVMLIYSEVTLLPVIMGRRAGAPEDHILFAAGAAGIACGISTLIQVIRFGRFGAGYTLFMGSSAAYMAGSIATITAGGFPLLATLSILVAPIEIVMAYFLRLLRHIVTPAVGGTILLLVVISLVPVGLHEWVGKEGSAFHGSAEHLLIGTSAMWILLGLSLFGNRTLRLWCPLLGFGGGFLVSWMTGLVNFDHLAGYAWLGALPGKWPGLTFDLHMDHLPLLIALAVLTVINGVQAIGNSMAVQAISHRVPRRIDYDVVQGTMYGDALGNVASGLLGTVPNETYSENISVLKVTGAASRSIGICGALLLMLLPFSPKVSMALVTLPTPIFGGFLLGLAAMMFPSGLELVFGQGINHRSGLMVGISLCIGILAESDKFFPDLFPISVDVFLSSGVAAGGLTAIILSVLFRLMELRGYTATIPAGLGNLPLLASQLDEAGAGLGLAQDRLIRLQLACEEIFVHISQKAELEGSATTLALRVNEMEGELRVELIYGEHLNDLHNIEMPGNLMMADESELDQMGLALFHKLITEFHHVEISGVTYLWFKLAA